MMQTIPIDSKIEEFRIHLERNPRSVLSARFGDGKTYFLKKVREVLSSEYYFVTLYPVNYSVAQNEDVFEYIKRDVLLQLANKQLLDKVDFTALTDSIFNWESLREVISFLLSFVPGGSVYNKLLSKAEGFHKKYEKEKSTWKKYNDSFTMQRGGLHECDGYTKLIQEAIKYVQPEGAKPRKSILIIEDLDRIDPKHLFRILNVLGAHIDEDKDTNKFGFDNIVVVMDYHTTEHIFHHFYGENANYKGYMSKFMSCYPFYYSLRSLAEEQLYAYIQKECGLPKDVVALLNLRAIANGRTFSHALAEMSIRDIVQVLGGIDSQYRDEIIELDDENKNKIRSSAPIVKLLAVLKRMDIKQLDLGLLLNALKRGHDVNRLNLIGDFMLIDSGIRGGNVSLNGSDFRMITSKDNGILSCKFENKRIGEPLKANVTEFFNKAFYKACDYVIELKL